MLPRTQGHGFELVLLQEKRAHRVSFSLSPKYKFDSASRYEH